MGGEFVAARGSCPTHHELKGRAYPFHRREAVGHADLLVHPRVPLSGYATGAAAVERMIKAGEQAARRALSRLTPDVYTA